MIKRALCILLLMSASGTMIQAQQEPEFPGRAMSSHQKSGHRGQALQAQQETEYLAPSEFDYRYKAEVYAIIIDARVAKEYRRERIPGALGIEGMDKLKLFADSMDTETPLYIYCDGESRSRTVAQYLGDQGFTRLYILRGGIREWKAADMPLDKKRLRRRRNPGLKWL